MRLIFWILAVWPMAFCGCRKTCIDEGHFIVPAKVSLSAKAMFNAGADTISLSVVIGYESKDIRDGKAINTVKYQQSPLYFSLTPIISPITSYRPDLLSSEYFEFITVAGKRTSTNNLTFNYDQAQHQWEIRFKLIPKKAIDGLILLRLTATEYKDRCLIIQPNYDLTDVSLNHHLANQLTFPFTPLPNDILFQIK